VIQRAEYRRVGRDEVIYRQGEEGHHFYVMLRGSVTMLSNRADFGNFELYLRSHYDGDVFGEQPQLFAKQGDNTQQVASDDQLRKLSLRDSTCIANDDCLVLEVSNVVKHEFYRNDSSNQYERCLYWLRKNAIFRLTEGFYLLQMIFNIESRTYYLGESLVRSGEVPEGMIIITSGQCRAILESVGLKLQDSGEFTRFQKQPKVFTCGNVRPDARVGPPAATEPQK
jgi:CRP-like cAMP-binding protein